MLRIVNTSTDHLTGRISVDCHVEERVDGNATKGAIESYGISPDQLQEQFNGSIKEWLRGIHQKMLKNHDNRKKAAIAVAALQGKTIFDEDEEINGNQSQPAGTKV